MWTTDLGTSFVYLVNYRILQMFTFSILFPHVLPLKTHPGSNWRSSAVLPWDDRRRSATSAVARRAAQRRPWRPRAPTRSAAPGGSPPARPGTPGTEWERLYDCDFRTTYWILSYLNLFIHFIHIISIYIIYIYSENTCYNLFLVRMKDACCGPQGLAWSLLVLLQSRGSPKITIPQTNVTTLVGLVSTILSQDRAVETVPQCPPHTSEHSDSRCRETRHPAEFSLQRAPTSPPVSLLPTLPPQPFLRVSTRIPEVPHQSVSPDIHAQPIVQLHTHFEL